MLLASLSCLPCITQHPSCNEGWEGEAAAAAAPCSPRWAAMQLTFSEKGLRKMMDQVKLFQAALCDAYVLNTFMVRLQMHHQ